MEQEQGMGIGNTQAGRLEISISILLCFNARTISRGSAMLIDSASAWSAFVGESFKDLVVCSAQ
jgi:hypothetical protein